MLKWETEGQRREDLTIIEQELSTSLSSDLNFFPSIPLKIWKSEPTRAAKSKNKLCGEGERVWIRSNRDLRGIIPLKPVSSHFKIVDL